MIVSECPKMFQNVHIQSGYRTYGIGIQVHLVDVARGENVVLFLKRHTSNARTIVCTVYAVHI